MHFITGIIDHPTKITMSLARKEVQECIKEVRQKLINIRDARRTLDKEEDALLFELTKNMKAMDLQSGSGIRLRPTLVPDDPETCLQALRINQKVKVLFSRMSKDNGKIGVVVNIGKMVTVKPDDGGRLIVRASKNLERV